MKKFLFFLVFFLNFLLIESKSGEVKVFEFTQEELKTLKIRKVKGRVVKVSFYYTIYDSESK